MDGLGFFLYRYRIVTMREKIVFLHCKNQSKTKVRASYVSTCILIDLDAPPPDDPSSLV